MARTYSGTLWFTNQLNATVQGRSFALLVGQTVVQNGGFETGVDMTGWYLSKYGYNDANHNKVWSIEHYDVESGIHGSDVAHSGGYGMMIGQSNSLGYISQTLQTVAGRPYILSFWLRTPYGGTPNEILVQWGGRTLFDQVDMVLPDWTNLQFVVMASDPTTLLKFGARNDPALFGLDDISAQLLVMPALGLVVPHTNASSISWSAATNLHYQAQYTTNLVPVNWINLGGELLGTGGTMTVTDPSPVSSQRFYRVLLQP